MENTGKTWKVGVANEPWKVIICAKEQARAEEILSGLAYIMTDCVATSQDEQAAAIAKFTGEEITDALLKYRNSAVASVRKALREGLL